MLVLTSGKIDDINETKLKLNTISENSPLSCVLVGIGDGDFSGMEDLDNHDQDTEVGRDITKFVRFNDYIESNEINKQGICEAVLDEIPEQLVTYFQKKGIQPYQCQLNENDIDTVTYDQDGDSSTLSDEQSFNITHIGFSIAFFYILMMLYVNLYIMHYNIHCLVTILLSFYFARFMKKNEKVMKTLHIF